MLIVGFLLDNLLIFDKVISSFLTREFLTEYITRECGDRQYITSVLVGLDFDIRF